MTTPNTPQPDPNPDVPLPPLPAWLSPVLSVAIGILLIIHLFTKTKMDTVALGLIGLAMLAWLLPRLSKFKAGGVEFELAQVQKTVQKLEEQTEAIVEAAAAPEGAAEVLRLTAETPPQTLTEALASGPYAFRSLAALSSATGRTGHQIEIELAGMVADGRAVGVRGKGGRRLWGLTAAGRLRT